MKNLTLIIFSLLFSQFSFSQKEANLWYFGFGGGLDFNSGYPVPLYDGSLNTIEGCASISNRNGQLLFYTDGVTIWNKKHLEMEGGQNLKGHISSTQSSIIVPKPYAPKTYYVFTTDFSGGLDVDDIEHNGLHYYNVNLSANNGLGQVINPDGVQIAQRTSEKLTAVSHSDGVNFWVLTEVIKIDDTKYIYAFFVDDNGVNPSPVITQIKEGVRRSGIDTLGYMKTSPNGEYLALVSNQGEAKLAIYKFNNTTGEVLDEILLRDGFNEAYGLEFSPSSNLLYVTDNTAGKELIYQYSLKNFDKEAIINSKEIISDYPSNGDYSLGAMQLGPDGRIYVSIVDSRLDPELLQTLSVISQPNLKGSDCNYSRNSIAIAGEATIGLPSFIQSFLKKEFIVDGLCFGSETTFTVAEKDIDSIEWDFGDPSSGAQNTSNLLNPKHTFTREGSFIVQAKATSKTGRNYIFEETVTITSAPTPKENVVFSFCSIGNEPVVNLSDIDELVSTKPNAEQVHYYLTEEDAELSQNELIESFNVNRNTIYAKVINIFNGCYAITSVELDALPEPNLAEFVVVPNDCVNRDGLPITNLNKVQNLLTNDKNVRLTYYLNEENAKAALEPLQETFTGTGTLFARAEFENGCVKIVSFTIDFSNKEACNKGCEPKIVTAFTPNANGKNDHFVLFEPTQDNCKVTIEKLEIYNRWGELIYNDISKPWNGQTANGDFVADGVYIYKVVFSSENDFDIIESKEITGSITVLF